MWLLRIRSNYNILELERAYRDYWNSIKPLDQSIVAKS